MKLYLFIFFLVICHSASANNLNIIDKSINKVILSWLDIQSDSNEKLIESREVCYPEEMSLISLKACHNYIDNIYITDDVDSYMSYVNHLLYFGIKVQHLPVFNKIKNAKYEEITSKLYFNIAHAAYLYQRYDESLRYLKKIDDSLDDESVYHALLIYGLIYFEKGEYVKSKQYFKRIDSSSRHYSSAQYNLGLISMRFSWWSEAEQFLNNSITAFDLKNSDKKQSIMMDKLYLTIGYSQISRKDFRSSKSSFSNISIDSPVKMRALMGIAISEIGLGNLGKSATILKIIKDKGVSTVKLDALVTLPQVYQKAGNTRETVNYYDAAILNMRSLLKKINVDMKDSGTSYSRLPLFDIDNDWIMRGFKNCNALLNELISYKSIGRENIQLLKKSKIKLELEKKKYAAVKIKIISELLKDYIKQSKYALAVIYDKSIVMKQ